MFTSCSLIVLLFGAEQRSVDLSELLAGKKKSSLLWLKINKDESAEAETVKLWAERTKTKSWKMLKRPAELRGNCMMRKKKMIHR